MAEKKRKFKQERRDKRVPPKKGRMKPRNNKKMWKSQDDDNQRRKGPRLPSQLHKEIHLLNSPPKTLDASDSDLDHDRFDLYEYDEPAAQEESMKNRRFDSVDNFEYQLPDDFEDENVPSSDDGDDDGQGDNEKEYSDEEAGDDDDDDERHMRMLQGITGLPREAFDGKKRKKAALFEDYPESAYNVLGAASNGDGRINIHDLLDPLHGNPGYSKLRKRLHQLEKHAETVAVPLPRVEREKLERKIAYEHSKKDITKWEPLVKRNREAPTVYFDEDAKLGYSTVGAIAAEFKPRTEFEKKIASVVYDPKVMEAHKQDGAKLLELNKVSVEDVKDRQNRLAKMHSLLFRHEIKAKRIKKIKSKTFHRILNRDRQKAAASEILMDPEAAKEYARKQEFKRAEERMTQRHKNSSKWAKRILERGLNVQDEGTRAAISEQLHQHALLTRKMNTMKDNSSSDDSSDEGEDDESADGEEPTELLARAKEKTLSVIEEEDEMPKTGVLSLPFMVRGMKKTKEAAYAEAQHALQEYDSSLRQLEDANGTEDHQKATLVGRRLFWGAKKQPQNVPLNYVESSAMDNDSDEDFLLEENVDLLNKEKVSLCKGVSVDPAFILEESNASEGSLFKSFDDVVKEPGQKTSFEVAIFASDSWRKLKSDKEVCGTAKASMPEDLPLPQQEVDGVDHNSKSESEEEMVDGILTSSGTKDYKLPSQAELIQRAFAGDDVEGEFEKDKLEVLNEEIPEPEKPVQLPGWGQWTHIQQKKGLPSWMVKEHEDAKQKREDALKKRRDANLKHVIISERIDKKAEKLHTTTLPFPFTSKEVFEQSIRMPIGPEFNPAISVGALNRPEVVKKAGLIIKPIKFEEVNPHETVDKPRHGDHPSKTKKNRSAGRKTIGKTNSKESKKRS